MKLSKPFIGLAIAAVVAATLAYRFQSVETAKENEATETADQDNEAPIPPAVPAAPGDIAAEPGAASVLGAYNVLIADRGNNRLVEVTPDKKVIWEYQFNLPKMGLGADDAFFVDGGKKVIVNLEEYHLIEIIDYASKQVVWSYGVPGVAGHLPGFLNTPDDAYHLSNGNVTVADIKNCRILEIAPDRSIVRQYGTTRVCGNAGGLLNKPNGDTPLPDGHTFVSNIGGHSLVELDKQWLPVFSLTFPITYPSDPQLTKAGNILVANYLRQGRVIEIARDGNVVWDYAAENGVQLDRPSLAVELPNGNVMVTDDFNHRIVVIDKQTKKVVWQYGVTGKPGSAAGQLNVPDGLDVIPTSVHIAPAPAPETLAVGKVTRHAAGYIGKEVHLVGYVLARQPGYAIVSDEATGTLSSFDLPVNGPGSDGLALKGKYLLDGLLLDKGLDASNKSPVHLYLLQPPQAAK